MVTRNDENSLTIVKERLKLWQKMSIVCKERLGLGMINKISIQKVEVSNFPETTNNVIKFWNLKVRRITSKDFP